MFRHEVWPDDSFATEAANRIAEVHSLGDSLVLTGGTTAAAVYPALARAGIDLSDSDIYFSDERCVPPTDEASNYAMALRTLFGHLPAGAHPAPERVHRMEGESPPATAADRCHRRVTSGAGSGFGLLLLGMGADCHIAGLYPGSFALGVTSSMCTVVARPDGLTGLTLTPPALVRAAKVLLIVSGSSKQEAVVRALTGAEDPAECPARLLADHPDATFLLDESAAALL